MSRCRNGNRIALMARSERRAERRAQDSGLPLSLGDWAGDCPVAGWTWRAWCAMSSAAQEAAVAVLCAHKAQPWVWAADGQHFIQFASNGDWAAADALGAEGLEALFGEFSASQIWNQQFLG